LLSNSCHKKRNVLVNETTISHVSFLLHINKVLFSWPFAEMSNISLKLCVRQCMYNEYCNSINYWSNMGHTTCYLLQKNMFNIPSNFIDSDDMTHLSIKNTGCDSGICQNNGQCFPNKIDGTFRCQCSVLFTGRYCESKVVANEEPAWYFPFNGTVINYGKYADQCEISLVKGAGRLTYVPDRVGKVLYCNGECTNSNIESEEWNDPDLSGVSVAFWVKLRPGEYQRQQGKSTFIFGRNKKEKGITVSYSNEKQMWEFEVRVLREGGGTRGKQFSNVASMKRKESSRWHHIALIYEKDIDNSELDVYIDGIATYNQKQRGDGFRDEDVETLQLFHPFGGDGCYYIDQFKVWYATISQEKVVEEYKSSK